MGTFKTVSNHGLRGGCRIYRNRDQRRKDCERLQRGGFNHFVPFRDVNGPALQWGIATWIPRQFTGCKSVGQVYIDGNVNETDRATHGADGNL